LQARIRECGGAGGVVGSIHYHTDRDVCAMKLVG
jgi:hypothetical protein